MVDPAKFRWRVGAAPVKKIRCEDWQARANTGPGSDVCTHLRADAVLEARVHDDGRGIGWSLGADLRQFR
ncbi:hypothetical protein P9869_15725 [Streptomyces ossamyceticus]|nr:hypothetical protein [Streptomyces ossamyceticus]